MAGHEVALGPSLPDYDCIAFLDHVLCPPSLVLDHCSTHRNKFGEHGGSEMEPTRCTSKADTQPAVYVV
jgi:hypothetical protein